MKSNNFSFGLICLFALFYVSCQKSNPTTTTTGGTPIKDTNINKNAQEKFRISASGSKVAYLDSKHTLSIIGLASKETISGMGNTIDFAWSTADELLYLLKKGNSDISLLKRKAGGIIEELSTIKGRDGHFLENPVYKEISVLCISNRGKTSFYSYSPLTGLKELELKSKDAAKVEVLLVDSLGDINLIQLSNEILAKTDKNKLERIVELEEGSKFKMLFPDPQRDRYLFALSASNDKHMALVRFSVDEGKTTELIFERDGVDITGLEYSGKSRSLAYLTYKTNSNEFKYIPLNSEFEKIIASIKQQHKETNVKLINWSLDEEYIAYAVAKNGEKRFYIYEVSSDKSVEVKLEAIS